MPIDDFFRSKGYTVEIHFGSEILIKSKYDELFDDYEVAIFSYFHGDTVFDGAHYVAITHNNKGGIDVYNYRNNSTDKVPFSSIEELINLKENRIPIAITVIK